MSLLKFSNNLVYLCPQPVLLLYNLFQLCIQLDNIHLLPLVLLLNIGGDRQVVISLCNSLIRDQLGDIILVLPLCKDVQDVLYVFLCEFVGVGDFISLLGGIYEQGAVILLGLLQHHYAGCNTGPKEKVVRKLDDAIHIVVVYQVLPDFLLCTTPVHNTRETYNGCCTIGGQPGQRVHDESQVCLGLGSQDTCWCKPGVIDEADVIISFPLDGVGWI